MEYLKILIQILKKCNSNNTAPSIGTIAGQCSDQRERNITTGLFGLEEMYKK